MIRVLSNRKKLDKPYTIGLVDERSEIAAMYKGVPQNDIGIRTDVMNNCVKSVGIRMMVRSMAPDIIATDEIGGENDIDAVLESVCLGVKLLLTIHGMRLSDMPNKLLNSNVFKNVIVLSKEGPPGFVKNIYKMEDNKYVDVYS